MPSPERTQYENAFYHVMNWGRGVSLYFIGKSIIRTLGTGLLFYIVSNVRPDPYMTIVKILKHLGLPTRAPPRKPARYRDIYDSS